MDLMDSSKSVQVIMFTCLLCDMDVKIKSGYREHMKICVFLNDEDTRLFPRFLCRRELLQNKTDLKKHLKMCSKKCGSKSNLKNYITIVHEKFENFKCDICYK